METQGDDSKFLEYNKKNRYFCTRMRVLLPHTWKTSFWGSVILYKNFDSSPFSLHHSGNRENLT